MLTTSWRDVIDERIPTPEAPDFAAYLLGLFRVYAIKDSAAGIVYVGQSRDATERLLQHIGILPGRAAGLSHVGRYITANMPAAADWQIDLYSLADCRQIYQAKTGDNRDEVLPMHGLWVTFVESAMISELCPWFNHAGVRAGAQSSRPLPDFEIVIQDHSRKIAAMLGL